MSLWTIKSMPGIFEAPAEHEGRTIKLLTIEEFDALPDGTRVISIHGEAMVKGVDRVDKDTRYGYMAFGLLK